MNTEILGVFDVVRQCWDFIPFSLQVTLYAFLGIFAFWSILRFVMR